MPDFRVVCYSKVLYLIESEWSPFLLNFVSDLTNVFLGVGSYGNGTGEASEGCL